MDAQEKQDIVRAVAEESLEVFARIADAARREREETLRGGGPGALAAVNTLTYEKAMANQRSLAADALKSYETLEREPAIARVVGIDENGQSHTYYVCRATPVPLADRSKKFVSYRAPLGRISEFRVGDEATIRIKGRDAVIAIAENARFSPLLLSEGWDARNAILSGRNFGFLSVESLRAALKVASEDILEALLAEAEQERNIREGRRRTVIDRMNLRDQPVLDRWQGEIFRLPLDRRLALLGPPGTGKTTTLIRRLGQKLDLQYLDEDEKRLDFPREDHARNWIMFTPTDLLKLYVKEAFSREGVPAPDERIQTWTQFRLSLARHEFGFLKTADNKSGLIMKETTEALSSDAVNHQIAWFEDFEAWRKEVFWSELRQGAPKLSQHQDKNLQLMGAKLMRLIPHEKEQPAASDIERLLGVSEEVKSTVDSLKKNTDKKIHSVLKEQVKRNPKFLEEFSKKIKEIGEESEEIAELDLDDSEGPASTASTADISKAFARYEQVMRVLARSKAAGRSLTDKKSAAFRLLEWLGDRVLKEEDQKTVGESVLLQSMLRAFADPVKKYVDVIPRQYRDFRRQRQANGKWYSSKEVPAREVHPLEADLILLSLMRASQEISGIFNKRAEDRAPPSSVEKIRSLYHTQVLVDEATDFSPLQLACMFALSRPKVQSFFACGDFNQRVTEWGAKSREEMKWAVPDLVFEEIKIAYRQSRRLKEFTERLASLSAGGVIESVLPEEGEPEGEAPVLKENMQDDAQTSEWLARRIEEIERALGKLPSIAVLVHGEDNISKIAENLDNELSRENIFVEACFNGKSIGNQANVRVFNVEHIKGLEFEAVFFVGIDKISSKESEIFSRYIYLGATRAASYLGISCEGELPENMKFLKGLFKEKWS